MDKAKIEQAVRMILEAIGEDPDREGLRDTPRRVADMLEEILEGYNSSEDYTVFMETGDMVVLTGIRFYSLCEHHLLPFFGLVHVAYVPRDRVIGISKIARIVAKYSRRLQIQERMTKQIAEELTKATGSRDVAVLVEGYHLCMIMRGVKNRAATVTAAMRGAFAHNPYLKQEFYQVIKPYRIKWCPL